MAAAAVMSLTSCEKDLQAYDNPDCRLNFCFLKATFRSNENSKTLLAMYLSNDFFRMSNSLCIFIRNDIHIQILRIF